LDRVCIRHFPQLGAQTASIFFYNIQLNFFDRQLFISQWRHYSNDNIITFRKNTHNVVRYILPTYRCIKLLSNPYSRIAYTELFEIEDNFLCSFEVKSVKCKNHCTTHYCYCFFIVVFHVRGKEEDIGYI